MSSSKNTSDLDLVQEYLNETSPLMEESFQGQENLKDLDSKELLDYLLQLIKEESLLTKLFCKKTKTSKLDFPITPIYVSYPKDAFENQEVVSSLTDHLNRHIIQTCIRRAEETNKQEILKQLDINTFYSLVNKVVSPAFIVLSLELFDIFSRDIRSPAYANQFIPSRVLSTNSGYVGTWDSLTIFVDFNNKWFKKERQGLILTNPIRLGRYVTPNFKKDLYKINSVTSFTEYLIFNYGFSLTNTDKDAYLFTLES